MRNNIVASHLLSVAIWAMLLGSVASAEVTGEQLRNQQRTVSIGFVLFPGFEPLDVFGPMELIHSTSAYYSINLTTIGFKAGPVGARPPAHSMGPGMPPEEYPHVNNPEVIATHNFDNAPPLDLIFIPGGFGNVALEQQGNFVIEDWLNSRFERADYVLTVCSGSVIPARAGLLKGKRATTNKGLWGWVTDPSHGENITWVPSARWTEDGKIWTSSGVAAGIDMTYAFFSKFYGSGRINQTMNGIEYAPHLDPHWDPFSVVHNVPGHDPSAARPDCARPVGT